MYQKEGGKLKILQIYELPPNDEKGTGGIEVAILETSRELVARGHEVTILTGAKDTPDEIIVDGVRIVSIDSFGMMKRTWKGSNLTFARQFLFMLTVFLNMHSTSSDNHPSDHLGSFDVYHGHIYSSGLIANYLARKFNAIAVNTIHGSYYPIWHTLTNPVVAQFYRTSERILAPTLARISDLQIHTGDYFAKQVLAWGADQNKVKTIHNGADIDTFNPKVPSIRFPEKAGRTYTSIEEGTQRSRPVILTARRLVKKNGIDYLIKATAHVLDKEECQLIIIGEGEERECMEELAAELNISDYVSFLGFIPHEKLPPYLQRADIVVVPSLVEASSIFMLEAMAMAKPVIATNTGGLPEVMTSTTGILVEPADEMELSNAIIELLRNKEYRSQLGINARKLMEERYSWKAVARMLESEYAMLLAAKKQR